MSQNDEPLKLADFSISRSISYEVDDETYQKLLGTLTPFEFELPNTTIPDGDYTAECGPEISLCEVKDGTLLIKGELTMH